MSDLPEPIWPGLVSETPILRFPPRPSSDEVREAIAIVQHSLDSHVPWLDHPADCSDCKARVAAEGGLAIAGDRAHHQECIDGYTKVIATLRKLLPDGQ